MVALSSNDKKMVGLLSQNPAILPLEFYDVSLVRESGKEYVGYKILFSIAEILANFMLDNPNSILCFYCDPFSDVRRNHTDMPPQEYRSRLFSKMFDLFGRTNSLDNFVNHRVEIEDPSNSSNKQYAHFICRNDQINIVIELGKTLMEK